MQKVPLVIDPDTFKKSITNPVKCEDISYNEKQTCSKIINKFNKYVDDHDDLLYNTKTYRMDIENKLTKNEYYCLVQRFGDQNMLVKKSRVNGTYMINIMPVNDITGMDQDYKYIY